MQAPGLAARPVGAGGGGGGGCGGCGGGAKAVHKGGVRGHRQPAPHPSRAAFKPPACAAAVPQLAARAPARLVGPWMSGHGVAGTRALTCGKCIVNHTSDFFFFAKQTSRLILSFSLGGCGAAAARVSKEWQALSHSDGRTTKHLMAARQRGVSGPWQRLSQPLRRRPRKTRCRHGATDVTTVGAVRTPSRHVAAPGEARA